MGNIENAQSNGLWYDRKDMWKSVRGGEDYHMIGERK